MKRFLSILLFIILFSCPVKAEVVRTDDAVVFLGAVGQLKHINSRESVEDAQQIFKGITSNYNQSNLFAIYASAIIDIYDGSYDDAQTKIDVLSMSDSFIKLLEKYELQSCNVLQQYIEGRRMEDAGDYQGALTVYATMNFLDSPERMIVIMGDAKEQKYAEAKDLFDAGSYEQAAQIFESLGNYKDSAEMACNASALIPTPSPTPTSTPAPTPEPTPVPWPASDDIFIYLYFTDEAWLKGDTQIAVWLGLDAAVFDGKESFERWEATTYSDPSESIQELNQCIDSSLSRENTALMFFPVDGIDYNAVLYHAIAQGKAVYMFSSVKPDEVYTEICNLWGKDSNNNPFK